MHLVLERLAYYNNYSSSRATKPPPHVNSMSNVKIILLAASVLRTVSTHTHQQLDQNIVTEPRGSCTIGRVSLSHNMILNTVKS